MNIPSVQHIFMGKINNLDQISLAAKDKQQLLLNPEKNFCAFRARNVPSKEPYSWVTEVRRSGTLRQPDVYIVYPVVSLVKLDIYNVYPDVSQVKLDIYIVYPGVSQSKLMRKN